MYLNLFGNVFFKCNRFPYEESVTNEWFTLPDDENDRKQPVMVINVNKEGKKSKCYLSQDGVDDFMKSIVDKDHQVFFHGTRHQYAQDIIEGGIDIKMGARRQDFSNGDGFYLGDDFEEACRWPASRGHPNTAVLVFRVEKTEVRDQDKGLDLRNDRTRWQELVWQFRSGKPDLKFVKSLRQLIRSRRNGSSDWSVTSLPLRWLQIFHWPIKNSAFEVGFHW